MSLIDLFFPKFCLGCSKPGIYFCNHCLSKLRSITTQTCFYCHQPSYLGLTHPGCKKLLGVDGFISFFYYNNYLKKVIKNIKYRLATEVWNEFIKAINIDTQLLIDFKNTVIDCHIEPIPLTKNKLLNRGFNQSQLITDYLNRYLKYQPSHLLIREIELKPQAEIVDKKNRYKNVNQSFSINRLQIKNKKLKQILLIDDVVTTGATIGKATKVLKQKYVDKVYIMSLAHG